MYEARMFGIGHKSCASYKTAIRALMKLRRQYRDSKAPLPYPLQTIVCKGKLVYTR